MIEFPFLSSNSMVFCDFLSRVATTPSKQARIRKLTETYPSANSTHKTSTQWGPRNLRIGLDLDASTLLSMVECCQDSILKSIGRTPWIGRLFPPRQGHSDKGSQSFAIIRSHPSSPFWLFLRYGLIKASRGATIKTEILSSWHSLYETWQDG